MPILPQLYRPSLALLNDLYQLTMAYGYWKSGAATREAAFHLFFRSNPFGGGFAIACGLEYVIEFVEGFRFSQDDRAWLATLCSANGQPLFEQAFLDYLGGLKLSVDIDAMPEGTPVFPHEPLLRVQGPIIDAQLLETALLNLVNFQTLVATKAARMCLAAQGDPIVEFGLRRAQGIDGGLAASRAAYVGGVAGTSNLLAGKLFGIPVRGTHAHSWVMLFDDEGTAFESYAQALPDNCLFLVDTYDTVEGVRRAVDAGLRLRQRGYEMLGVRLDSGDLARLSVEAREILDEGGFPDAVIVASNDLDEHLIASLKKQGAAIGVWGVGTRLVTGHDQPALGGVYKLSAVREAGGPWEHRLKLSEQAIKTSNPGLLQVRRFADEGCFVGDLLYDVTLGCPATNVITDPRVSSVRVRLPTNVQQSDLLVSVVRTGRRAYQSPPLDEIRRYAGQELARLPEAVKRLCDPQPYPVALEPGLNELKEHLIQRARRQGR